MNLMEGQITLSSFGDGAAEEKFSDALDRVLENILDPNIPWKGKRTITLTFEIEPREQRDLAIARVNCTIKTVPPEAHGTHLLIGQQGKRRMAAEYNPQTSLVFEEPEHEGVLPIRPKKENGND